ncbi:MAG TPA: hypothetical protein VIH59_07635 [Candidatus Tectomicrobia bacterium]|jgi:hypothetical protein
MLTRRLTGNQLTATISATLAWGQLARFTGVGFAHPTGEAATIAHNAGDWSNAAACMQRLGDIALACSEHQETRQRYEAALPSTGRGRAGRSHLYSAPGGLTLARSEPQEAHKAFEAALTWYARIPEAYSIGEAHRRLACLTPDSAARMRHVQAARTAWEGIDRPDLLAALERELGT